MRFLADESCDFEVVRALRGAGDDVSAVTDLAPGADDEQVLAIAANESRVLLTEDKASVCSRSQAVLRQPVLC